MTCIWLERLNNDDISDRLKDLNPSVEAPAATIMTHISSILRDGQTGDVNYDLAPTSSLQEAELSMDIRLGGGSDFPKVHLKWIFKGKRASDTVNVLVTMPLLRIAAMMNAEIESLQRLITKKDVEIRDYKAQGGKVSRKHLETKPFDASEFKSEIQEKLHSLNQSPAAAVFAAAHVRDLYAETVRDLALPDVGQGQGQGLHDRDVAGDGLTGAAAADTSNSGAGSKKPQPHENSAVAAGGCTPGGPEAELAEEKRRREELQQRRRQATCQPIAEPPKKARGKKGLL